MGRAIRRTFDHVLDALAVTNLGVTKKLPQKQERANKALKPAVSYPDRDDEV